MSKTPATPLKSPLRTPYSAGMSKLSQSSAASSPFFSSPSGRGGSPSKLSDFELIGVDDEEFDEILTGTGNGNTSKAEAGDVQPGTDVGDDTVCSNFSDVTATQYGAGKTAAQESPIPTETSTAKESPIPKGTPTTRKRAPTLSKISQDASSPTAVRESTSYKKPRLESRLESRPTTPSRTPVGTPRKHNTRSSSKGSSSPLFTPQNSHSKLPIGTPNLLDFTTQLSNTSGKPSNQTPSHSRTRSASPYKTESPKKLPLPPSTPAENRFFSLLDFDSGPLATPRSIPSVTPREVETLKATFNTQIAQLKAEISGRETEVTDLRSSIAESESTRAELTNNLKEVEARIEEERENWRSVKKELGELFEAEKTEKETLQLDAEKREIEVTKLREQLEEMARELADSKLRISEAKEEAAAAKEEASKARKEADEAIAASSAEGKVLNVPVATTGNVQAEVEKVARELHTLYKAKHETKVAALKKSYESRWEKKVIQLTTDLEAEKRKNEELAAGIVEKGAGDMTNEFKFSDAAEKELRDELAKLKRELNMAMNDLDMERREKGELVGAVEELLAIQTGININEDQAAAETEVVKKKVARVSGAGLPSSTPPPPPPAAVVARPNGAATGFGLKSGIARMGGGGGIKRSADEQS
ncbi:uncharacterized protein H6S33_002724 [Morchella sextelata]|uniref:uncharacterized protein n=1 Tax=Morchella sextelata TaxID=1174677 RepID=UPI001D041259|nr:uncharacterized protein H6S33_002724 [Morchella sextelata]KAH0607690.1 hypothetical protein H6S33_002724 [Morchella sextelata]